jgi:hypothetical protein
MRTRFLLVVTCIVALAAVQFEQRQFRRRGTARAPARRRATRPPRPAAPAARMPPGRPLDPALAQEIAMAAQMLKGEFPLKQGDVTVTNIQAQGGELIYSMQLPKDLNEEQFEQFRQMLPAYTCQNPQARQMLERGGTQTYRITDSEGEEFTASVSSCS